MKKFGLVVMLMLFALMVFAPIVGAMERNPSAIDMGITVVEACEVAIMVAAIPEAPPGIASIVASATTLKNVYIMTTTGIPCGYIEPGPVIAISAIEFAEIFGTKGRPVYSDAGLGTYTMRYASIGVQHRPGHTLQL